MLTQLFTSVTIICIVLLFLDGIEKYDYARENPNALQHGQNISGTVYADYPNNTPGLGWIL
jgi:hypothetical protein